MARMLPVETALEVVKGFLHIFGSCGCIVGNKGEQFYFDSGIVGYTSASGEMNKGMVTNEMRNRI